MSPSRACPVVGLVGGIGSGKSSIARRAAERFGFALIDGDASGHQALELEDVKGQLREQFGNDVFRTDGSVNRSALARRVFGTTTDHVSAKAALERITHPIIEEDFRRQIELAIAAGVPAVLLDAAVLLEAGWQRFCDLVIYVDTSDIVRHERVASRGWSEADLRSREASQLPLHEKQRRANIVISNDSTLDAAVNSLVTAIGGISGNGLLEASTASHSTV